MLPSHVPTAFIGIPGQELTNAALDLFWIVPEFFGLVPKFWTAGPKHSRRSKPYGAHRGAVRQADHGFDKVVVVQRGRAFALELDVQRLAAGDEIPYELECHFRTKSAYRNAARMQRASSTVQCSLTRRDR